MGAYFGEFIITVLLVSLAVLTSRLLLNGVRLAAARRSLPHAREVIILRSIQTGVTLVTLVLLLGVWGIEGDRLWIFTTTIIGFAGVAIFAIWSLLSNILASILLVLTAPFRIDDWITFRDGDNSVTGQVQDMTIMFVIIVDLEGRLAKIPNNMIFQRVILKHPTKPDKPVGKNPKEEVV